MTVAGSNETFCAAQEFSTPASVIVYNGVVRPYNLCDGEAAPGCLSSQDYAHCNPSPRAAQCHLCGWIERIPWRNLAK